MIYWKLLTHCLIGCFCLWPHGYLSILNLFGGNMAEQTSLGQGALGTGLAENASILEQYRPAYNQLAQQLMEQGQAAPDFVQWASQQHATQPQPPTRRGMLETLFSKIGKS